MSNISVINNTLWLIKIPTTITQTKELGHLSDEIVKCMLKVAYASFKDRILQHK